jgi:hypothetical protein
MVEVLGWDEPFEGDDSRSIEIADVGRTKHGSTSATMANRVAYPTLLRPMLFHQAPRLFRQYNGTPRFGQYRRASWCFAGGSRAPLALVYHLRTSECGWSRPALVGGRWTRAYRAQMMDQLSVGATCA